ncbi:Arginase, catabolizes arginine to ornithine and urea [Microbotryomycetes sp. JL221]|nr:Arginase, catabolizes arginine to ornithine and urea [Microbotryomycetes sp. JL221]
MTRSNFLKTPLTAGIVAAPFSGGQPKAGVDTGPLELVSSGLLDDIQSLGWAVDFKNRDQLDQSITSDGDKDTDIGKLKKPRLVSRVNKELAERVYEHASQGQLTVTLGGDHSLAMGTVSGTFKQYPNAALIWIDAHADINTPLTTPSGNLHGCPVSFLMGLPGTSEQEIPEFGWIKPCLKADSLVYIGLRDIDEGERKILKENNIKCFTMYHVDKYGIGKVVDMALDHVGRERPIHLSFDVDALDPVEAPSTGTAVRGGLTFREGHYICEAIAETGNLVSFDIMEINPSLGDSLSVKQTVNVGRSLTRCALGETLL